MKEILNTLLFKGDDMMKFKQTIFHRTYSEEVCRLILSNGFKLGRIGIYATYDFLSTQGEDGSTGGDYGDFIVKADIDIHGFIIDDKELCVKVYGEFLTPKQQIKKLYPEISEKYKDILDKQIYYHNSKDYGDYPIWNYMDFLYEEDKSIINILPGHLSKQGGDGSLITIFKPELINPISYTYYSLWDEDNNPIENVELDPNKLKWIELEKKSV